MVKLKDEVLEFILSGEYEKEFDGRILKRVDLPSGKLSSYYDTDIKTVAITLGSTTDKFRFIVENDTGNVIMLSSLYLNDYKQSYIESVYQNQPLFKKQDAYLRNIQAEISANILDHMSALEEEILKTINVDDYMERAEIEYKRKNTLENPFLRKHYTMDAHMIDAYENDKAMLRDISIKQIESSDFKRYEEYIGLKYAIEKYEKTLLADPITSRKKAICDIISDDKYKSFTVKYRSLNGVLLDEKVNKTRAANSDLKSRIMDADNICSIPVAAIEQIVWGKQVLYDTNKFPKLELTDEDIKFNFATTGSISDLSKEDFANKSLMKRVIARNDTLFRNLDPSLLSDKTFIKEVLDGVKTDNAKIRIFSDDKFDKSLYSNEDFILYFLKSLSDNNRETGRYNWHFGNFIRILIDNAIDLNPYSLEIPLLILEKTNDVSEQLAKALPSSIWSDERAIEILSKTKFNAYEPRIIAPKIKNVKDLKKIFTSQELISCLSVLDKDILYEREFIIDILNNSKAPRDIRYSDLVTLYSGDSEMIDAIIHNMTANINVIELADLLNPKYDSKKRFELVDKNVMFFNSLTQDDQKTYLAGEFGDMSYVNIEINKGANSITINAPNSKYDITRYGYIFISDPTRDDRIDIKRFSHVADFFVDLLKNEFPDAPTKKGIANMVSYIIDHTKEINNDEPER